MEQFINLPLVASFLKNYGQTIMGIVPRKQKAAAEQHAEFITLEIDPESVVSPDIHGLLTSLMQNYYKSVSRHMGKLHKAVKKMERHNNETLFARGELSEESKQRFEKATKAYEKFLGHTQTLADALALDMPDLPEDEAANKQSSMVSNSGNAFQQDGKESSNVGSQGMWEDEDARKFYEDLPDLRILVPDVFLENQTVKKDEEEQEKEQQPEEEEIIENEDVDPLEEAIEYACLEMKYFMKKKKLTFCNRNVEDAAGDEDGSIKPTQNAQLEGFIARLPNCANRDLIDAAAVDFCYMNNKNARNKLVKALLKVQRQRLDLLPYYARFIATLNVYFSDIGETIIAAVSSLMYCTRSFHLPSAFYVVDL